MSLVIEPRHVVVGLRHEASLNEPPLCMGIEER